MLMIAVGINPGRMGVGCAGWISGPEPGPGVRLGLGLCLLMLGFASKPRRASYMAPGGALGPRGGSWSYPEGGGASPYPWLNSSW